MVCRCVAFGCSNTKANGYTLHQFPKNEKVRKLWERFVRTKRADFKKSHQRSQLCSAHFTPDCYVSSLQSLMGLRKYRALIPGSIPTIYFEHNGPQETSRKGNASRKLEVSRLQQEMLGGAEMMGNENSPSLDIEDVPGVVGQEGLGVSPRPQQIDASTQTDDPIWPLKEQGGGPNISTQTDLGGPQWLAEDTWSEDEDDREMSDDERKDPTFTPTKWVEMEEEMEEGNKAQYEPRSTEQQSENEKYLVYGTELLKLFNICRSCHEPCTPKITKIGTYISISNKCPYCDYTFQWESQPKIRYQALGNIELSAAILFSGCPISRTFRMLDFLGVAHHTEQAFYDHQRDLLQPVIMKTWQDEQMSIFQRLKAMDSNLVLVGDGRSDSPGHCAKYGGYNVIEARINKVIDIQVVQSNEVPNSCWCEHEGLKRSIKTMQDHDLKVDVIITDRHPQNTAWIRKELGPLGVQHYFDIWHVAKGLGKKVDAIAKQKECSDVGLWRKSIVNHLYYVAAKAKGCGELAIAMWQSLVNHIQDVHEDHSELYPKCDHGPLTEPNSQKQWILPGTLPGDKLADLMENRYLVKDVKKLSPIYQTSGLEAFHSLIIQFAPKHTAYSYQGMTTRLLLAALHYNENSDRLQAVCKDGRPQFALRFPKAKKGEHSVYAKKTKATFNYAFIMINKAVSAVKDGSTSFYKEESIKNRASQPEPLAASIENRPTKPDAVKEYISFRCRFSNGT